MIKHFEKISRNECEKRLKGIRSLFVFVGEILETKDVDELSKNLKQGLSRKKSMKVILIEE